MTDFLEKTTRATAAITVLLWAGLAVAEGAAAPGLSEAVESAFRRNPELGLSDAVRGQSLAIRRQADAWFAADTGVVLRHENDAPIDANGFRNWEGGVEMPLWLPGQRRARTDEADSTAREADAIEVAQRWRVAGEIRELLWSLRMAAVEAELARQALDSARALERDVDRRLTAGELARADLVLAQRESLARELELTVAVSERDALSARYKLLTGFSAAPVNIEEGERAMAGDGLPLEHPLLVEARAGAERMRSERDRVRKERRANPVLLLGGKSERSASGEPYDSALVAEFSLPLGAPGQAAPRLAEAERRLTEQAGTYARAVREVEAALIDARAERTRTEQALQLTRRERDLAAESLRLRKRAFDLGESDLFALLQARTQALASERDFRLRELERGRAIARFNQAVGELPR